MLTPAVWERFLREAERLGLPLTGALALERHAGLFTREPPPPGATHAVILMQAGGAFWEGLRSLRALDAALDASSDPLDLYTGRMAHRLGGLLGPALLETRFPFASQLDFVALGEAAGLGRPSRLAMLIHPAFGLWTAFRMLFFVSDGAAVLAPASPLPAAACAACAAPCIAACPAGAIRGGTGAERLDYAVSYRYRRDHPGVCAEACDARLACPVGAAHRYPEDALRHSHRRAWNDGITLVNAVPAPPLRGQGSLF